MLGICKIRVYCKDERSVLFRIEQKNNWKAPHLQSVIFERAIRNQSQTLLQESTRYATKNGKNKGYHEDCEKIDSHGWSIFLEMLNV